LKKQIQELLKKGETAKAYQKAKMLLSKQALAQQMDQMADMAELSVAQIQANNSMNRMTHMMGQSSRTMNAAQKNMNPERVRDCYYYYYPDDHHHYPPDRDSLCYHIVRHTYTAIF
jgi:hypothetical protein